MWRTEHRHAGNAAFVAALSWQDLCKNKKKKEKKKEMGGTNDWAPCSYEWKDAFTSVPVIKNGSVSVISRLGGNKFFRWIRSQIDEQLSYLCLDKSHCSESKVAKTSCLQHCDCVFLRQADPDRLWPLGRRDVFGQIGVIHWRRLLHRLRFQRRHPAAVVLERAAPHYRRQSQ